MVMLLTYVYVDVYIRHQSGGLESIKDYQESVKSWMSRESQTL